MREAENGEKTLWDKRAREERADGKNVVTQCAKPGHPFESCHQLSALIEWQEREGARYTCGQYALYENKFVILPRWEVSKFYCNPCITNFSLLDFYLRREDARKTCNLHDPSFTSSKEYGCSAESFAEVFVGVLCDFPNITSR